MAKKKNLPSPTPGASDVAALTTGIALAVFSLLFKEAAAAAALAAPVATFAISKFVERPKAILMERLRQGDVSLLTNEQHAELVPMTYRFFEAARSGEYEHTLKVLAAFIAGELKQETPEAGNVARMARRLEGISVNELRIIAHIADGVMPSANPRWVSVSVVKGTMLVAELRDDLVLFEGLHELSRRGFLAPKKDVDFFAKEDGFEITEAFHDLVEKAGSAGMSN